MSNWFAIFNAEDDVEDAVEDPVEDDNDGQANGIKLTVELVYESPGMHILPRDLVNDINNFDKKCLNNIEYLIDQKKYYFYTLLEEIRYGIKLRATITPSTFLSKFDKTLRILINSKRISGSGILYSYTDQIYTDEQYADAYKRLRMIEIHNKYRLTFNVGFGLFVFCGLGLLVKPNSFISGIYFTNAVMYTICIYLLS